MSILRSILSYVPTLWQTGDVITAEKLNNIENGLTNNSGTFIVTYTVSNNVTTSDKTLEEILSAYSNGKFVIALYNNSFMCMTMCNETGVGFETFSYKSSSSNNTIFTYIRIAQIYYNNEETINRDKYDISVDNV